MRKLNWSGTKVLFAILSVIILIKPAGYAEQEGTINAKITGKITNLKKARKHLGENPYLFILHPEQKFSMTVSATGNLAIKPADNQKCDIPESGEFTLNATKLKPGTYMMFVQPVNGFTITMGGNNYSTSFVAKQKEKKMIDVVIPEQSPGEPFALDLGKVWITIP